MKFSYIPPVKCIKCGKELKPYSPEDEKDYDMVHGGVVGRIYSPYGSTHDGFVYQIGICDDCIEKTPELVLIGDYIYGVSAAEMEQQKKEANKKCEELRPTFEKLKEGWIKESRFVAYQDPLSESAKKIVEMGFNTALYFVMEEMQKDPIIQHWFLIATELFKSLKHFKGPEIPVEMYGDIDSINKLWLNWLRENGFLERK